MRLIGCYLLALFLVSCRNNGQDSSDTSAILRNGDLIISSALVEKKASNSEHDLLFASIAKQSSLASGSEQSKRAQELLSATGRILQTDGNSTTHCTAHFVSFAGRSVGMTAGHCLPAESADCSKFSVSWLDGDGYFSNETVCEKVLKNTCPIGNGDCSNGDLAFFSFRPASPSQAATHIAPIELAEIKSEDFAGKQLWLIGFSAATDIAYSSNIKYCNGTVQADGVFGSHKCSTKTGMSGSLLFFQNAPIGMHVGEARGSENAFHSVKFLISSLGDIPKP